MRFLLGLTIVLLGAVLVIQGLDAFDAVSSGVSRLFTGSPSERTLGMVIGGALAVVIGVSIAGHHRHQKT